MYVFDWQPSKYIGGLLGILILYYLFMNVLFGWGGFKEFNTTGKYRVGARVIRSDPLGNEVLVMYPMDEDEYQQNIGSSNMPYSLHHNKTFELTGRVFATAFTGFPKWRWSFLPIYYNNLDCVENGKLASDFVNGKKKMHSVVFSHGIAF